MPATFGGDSVRPGPQSSVRPGIPQASILVHSVGDAIAHPNS